MNYALLVPGLCAMQHPDYPIFGSSLKPSSLVKKIKQLLQLVVARKSTPTI